MTGVEEGVAIATAVTAVAAAGATTYDTVQQSKQQAAYAKYDEKSLANQAEAARQQGVAAEQQQRARARDFLANAISTTAETGVDWSGSRAAVIGQGAGDAEYDALLTRYEGQMRASGLSAAADLAGTKAAASRAYATTALYTGVVSAGAAGLGAYASVMPRAGGRTTTTRADAPYSYYGGPR